MTHQNDHLAQGRCVAWMPRRARRPVRGWDTKTLRAFGADETASFIPCPWARPVLRMGHSIGAQVGHFSRAPKSIACRKGGAHAPLMTYATSDEELLPAQSRSLWAVRFPGLRSATRPLRRTASFSGHGST